MADLKCPHCKFKWEWQGEGERRNLVLAGPKCILQQKKAGGYEDCIERFHQECSIFLENKKDEN
tara:strand:+ start:767 stop:958 length:192 start_codon:yes stop_codon:yes gene_type:complete